MSPDCIAILLEDISEPDLIGSKLGIQERTMKAIRNYYNNDQKLVIKHMVAIWLMTDPVGPVKQLKDILNAQGHYAIAQKMSFLSSPGQLIQLH